MELNENHPKSSKLQNGPAENIILFITFADKNIVEELAKKGVIKLVPQAKRAEMIEIFCKLS